MTAGGVMGAFGSLLFVLALLGVVLHLLRRFTGGRSGSGGDVELTVLRRASLGPRQGVAVMRIGERVVVLSTGEGGVRQLLELSPGEVSSASVPGACPPIALVRGKGEDRPPQGGELPADAPFVERLQQALRRGLPLLVLIVLAAAGSRAAAQDTRPLREGTPQQPAVARLPTAVQHETRGAGSIGAETLRATTATPGAPQLDLRLGGSGEDGLHLSGAVGTIVMLGLLAMLPTLVLMMTSFTRILIVLQLLRQALGTQSAPPGHLIAAFALLLTGFVMAPTIAEANRTAIQPWLEGSMQQGEMLQTAVVPFRQFMLRQTREQDLATFVDMSGVQVASPDSVSLPVLVSAFATSELRSAFQIGFVLFLPFIIIDIVVAAVLMSMGMFMLPPAMISLPFKLLLFVLVDGWTLIVQSLVLSFR